MAMINVTRSRGSMMPTDCNARECNADWSRPVLSVLVGWGYSGTHLHVEEVEDEADALLLIDFPR